MRTSPAVLAAAFATTGLAAQTADSLPPVRSYHTVAFHFADLPQSEQLDLFFTFGRALQPRADGPWMLRVDAGAGVSLYGSIEDVGYIVGTRPSAAYVLRGDYLEIGVPVELYATLGGGVYAGWNLTTTEARSLVPLVSAGGGLRFRGLERLGMLELLWERPFALWKPRLSWRLGVHWPRRGA